MRLDSRWLAGIAAITFCGSAAGEVTVVDTIAALRQALARARPGDTVRIEPGEYVGGLTVIDLHGTAAQPIAISGDPRHAVLFKGGSGLHFVRPQHVVIEHITVEGASGNGINIDDGGDMDQSAHHVTLFSVVVCDVGPRGNHDGIKLSGLRDFEIDGCIIENWGDGGSGIDMVGCRDGLIVGCDLKHQGDTAASSGIQAKGGTRDVTIRRCRFEHVGRRGVNLGGSTGDAYFRPPLRPRDNVEAERVTVEDSVFLGCEAPVAFTSSRACVVRHNLFHRPGKWVVRILQEQPLDRFAPAQAGVFENNIVVWRQGDLSTFVNIGPDTKPESFRFDGNWWYCADAPAASEPTLPGQAEANVVGRDPGLADRVGGERLFRDASPARGLAGPRDALGDEPPP